MLVENLMNGEGLSALLLTAFIHITTITTVQKGER